MNQILPVFTILVLAGCGFLSPLSYNQSEKKALEIPSSTDGNQPPQVASTLPLEGNLFALISDHSAEEYKDCTLVFEEVSENFQTGIDSGTVMEVPLQNLESLSRIATQCSNFESGKSSTAELRITDEFKSELKKAFSAEVSQPPSHVLEIKGGGWSTSGLLTGRVIVHANSGTDSIKGLAEGASTTSPTNTGVVPLGDNLPVTSPRPTAVVTPLVDSTPPTISGYRIIDLPENKKEIRIVRASDAGVGLHDRAYSFDGGVTWKFENFKVFEKGRIPAGTIQVRDKVGNIFKVKQFIILE
jgi:hypothetical protein